ncbi:MAG: hypothetical protein KJ970_16070 [Candidatus Eisenbacteria bacterium]|uniref:Uncharacterized protein n=1 Tax=Eiseniibacteriota bacterium TaxID=2212470 RepID=A0A948W886_UNCEI|nr:hypothetical protein [Candidatus Eisenbacteria bacterium]MBU1950579.1 hypothetical protein [Candidatus Eisenbacteria bacterium]MBU2692441.1 hypothetical protein [Candidatus Eisenbacteria bacterium]
MRRTWVVFAGVILLGLSQIQCLLKPEEGVIGSPLPNERPHVRITGGVFNEDPAGVDFRVKFLWHGWDNDGIVTGFEWAVDDTTLERAWRGTFEFGEGFNFRATTFDPADSSFYDWHRFFIRSIDNEFERSKIDSRYFNARTIAPNTKITFPIIADGSLLLRRPRTFNVTWKGEDLDSSTPVKLPVYYEYKLVNVNLMDDPGEALIQNDNIFLDTLLVGDKTKWIRISAEISSLRLTELPLGELYVFGIRAIDEAGAIEPFLEQARNYFRFEVTNEECQPIVTIRENRLGAFTFPSDGTVWKVEVPSKTPIRFRWEGDAAFCGSGPGNVNYSLDIEDPGDEYTNAPNGIGGWIGWGLWDEIQTPLMFPDTDNGITHNFYVKMLDESNNPRSVRFCWVQIKVIAFSFNRTALIVDDATLRPYFYGNDAVHDAFRNRLFQCVYQFMDPGEALDVFDIYGRQDEHFNAARIPLELIASYKLLIWNSFFFGTLSSGLARNEVESSLLTNYVGAGGRVYFYGSKIVGCLAGDNFNYDDDGLCPSVPGVDTPAWDQNDFIWKFLHLRNCVKKPSSNSQQVDGWIGSRAVHPLYPDLRINPDVWDPETPRIADGLPVGGTIWFEVYKKGRTIPIRREPGLDTIYVAETFKYQNIPSQIDGCPIALRYESTSEDSALSLDQGRIFFQLFPFFPCQEGPAAEAARKAVTWMMTGRDE